MHNYKILLKRGHYPFPDLLSPYVERLETDAYHIIDTEYTFLSEATREKYKRMRLDMVSSRMFPIPMDYERVIPGFRLMLWITVFDDYYEYCSIEELNMLRKRALKVLNGDEPAPKDPLDYQVARMRDEFRAFMPQIWMERFAKIFNSFIQYGMQEEAIFKAGTTPPPFALFRVIREHCIGMHPFIPLADVQMDFVLPQEIEDHPVIIRLKSLTARIISWQNDLRSWPKEIGRPTEVINGIFVLQHERNLSFEEANEEIMRIHDIELAEFVALQGTLPHFGICHNKVQEYVDLLGIMIQGLNTWYDHTDRYLPGAKGYPEPEYDRSA